MTCHETDTLLFLLSREIWKDVRPALHEAETSVGVTTKSITGCAVGVGERVDFGLPVGAKVGFGPEIGPNVGFGPWVASCVGVDAGKELALAPAVESADLVDPEVGPKDCGALFVGGVEAGGIKAFELMKFADTTPATLRNKRRTAIRTTRVNSGLARWGAGALAAKSIRMGPPGTGSVPAKSTRSGSPATGTVPAKSIRNGSPVTGRVPAKSTRSGSPGDRTSLGSGPKGSPDTLQGVREVSHRSHLRCEEARHI